MANDRLANDRPVSYFAKYSKGKRTTSGKSPTSGMSDRELDSLLKTVGNPAPPDVHGVAMRNGLAGKLPGGAKAGEQFDNPADRAAVQRAKDANLLERGRYMNRLNARVGIAEKELKSYSRENFKKRTEGYAPVEGPGGLSVGDRMWLAHKNDLAKASKTATDAPDRSPAMGGVQFTGPGNAPFKVGVLTGPVPVKDYARAKLLEAQEHAASVAIRSAQLKQDQKEREAKAWFKHTHFQQIRDAEREEAAYKRMEHNYSVRRTTAMNVINEQLENTSPNISSDETFKTAQQNVKDAQRLRDDAEKRREAQI